MKRLAIGALAVSTSLFSIGSGVAQEDPVMDRYGVCGGTDPACYNDWYDRTSGEEAPWKILIYHNVGYGVAPHDTNAEGQTRATGVVSIEKMLIDAGYEVTTTRNPHDMESGFNIRKYDAIIFFNTGRDALTSLGQTSLRIYVEGGGGFVGIHNAFGTQYNWDWYEGLLGGQLFDHDPLQPGTVVVHSENDVSVSHIPEGQEWTDEWYNIKPNPLDYNVRMLLSVDTSTLLAGRTGYYGHPGMDPHPVAWCHYYDGGRAWLTTLGHKQETLDDEIFQRFLLGGIESAMGKEPFCQE